MTQAVKALFAAIVVAGLVAGASCKEIRKQVADKVVKEATKQVVSPEGCDVAMGQNMTSEDQEEFKKKMEPILDEIKTAEDPLAAFDAKKPEFRALFAEYVKKHSLDAECTDMLTDKFMQSTKEQIPAAQ